MDFERVSLSLEVFGLDFGVSGCFGLDFGISEVFWVGFRGVPHPQSL